MNSKKKEDPMMNAVQLMLAVKLMKEMSGGGKGSRSHASRPGRPAPDHAQLSRAARRRK